MTDKRAIAKKNFLKDGMSDVDNAAQCGVTRQTIARWRKEGEWDSVRDALEESVRDKYIESESERIVRDISDVDKEHRRITERLRSDFQRLVMGDKTCDMDELSILSAKIRVAGELLKLEREVLGLNKIKAIEKPPQFPTSFIIQVQTTKGPVLLDPVNMPDSFLSDLERQMPNQNPEHYGDVPEEQRELTPEEKESEERSQMPYTLRMIT